MGLFGFVTIIATLTESPSGIPILHFVLTSALALPTAKIFSTPDANSVYWQIPVKVEDRDEMAFVCHSGLYRYKPMPFGLYNAPALFQRELEVLLSGFNWKTSLVYLDNVIGFSNSVEKHL